MKLVIDIPEDIYTRLFDNGIEISLEDREIINIALRRGTPLPEKHGRLIDADAFIEQEACFGYIDCMDVDTFNERTSTIIAAAG